MPQPVAFRLESLGWKAFQDLCGTILREILGQTFQTFAEGHDIGRDGGFYGSWRNDSATGYEGAFTVQCKHTTTPGKRLTPGAIEPELEKLARLHGAGLADVYVLMTNLKLSGAADARIRERIKNTCGVDQVLILGSEWICRQIAENRRLRSLVPRLYGLGDLSEILDDRAYDQSEQLLKTLQPELSRFVRTKAYQRALHALERHNFVCLVGPAASGKTIIAATLALVAADRWKTRALKLQTAKDFRDHWNPKDQRQLIWVDDAFGQTQYQAAALQDWMSAFPHVHASLHSGTRVVFTTRDYIYQRAKADLKPSVFPLLDESQVVINVKDLTATEREEILYNHIRYGDQPREFKRHIKSHLPSVAAHSSFAPEIARRLGHHAFTKQLGLAPSRDELQRFVKRNEGFFIQTIRSLAPSDKSALALVFMNPDGLVSPIQFTDEMSEITARLGSSKSEVLASVSSLAGSFLRLVLLSKDNRWQFHHPSMRDAFARYLKDERELLPIYLQYTRLADLFQEITCGRVRNLQGVSVILRQASFAAIGRRVYESFESSTSSSGASWFTLAFLADRCSYEFLRWFFGEYPDIWKICLEGFYPSTYTPEARLLVKARRMRLLPAEVRRAAVHSLQEWAAFDTSFGWVAPHPSSPVHLMTDKERLEFLERASDVVVPRILDCADVTWEERDPKDPEDVYGTLAELRDSVVALVAALEMNDIRGARAAAEVVRRVEGLMEDVEWPDQPSDEEDPDQEVGPLTDSLARRRSRFDDVDA